MAKEYVPPKGFRPFPQQDFTAQDWKAEREKHEVERAKWIQELTAFLKTIEPAGDLIGEIVSWPVADGYAEYLIVGQKGGIKLIHLDDGDGYRVMPETIRGLRVQDARDQIERARTLRRIFSEKR